METHWKDNTFEWFHSVPSVHCLACQMNVSVLLHRSCFYIFSWPLMQTDMVQSSSPIQQRPKKHHNFFSEALTRIQEWLNKSFLLLNSKKQCLYLPNNQLRWCTLICSCKVKCTRLQMSLNILNSSVSCRTLEFTKQRTQGCSGPRGQAESLNSHKETQGQTPECGLECSNVSPTIMEKMSCLLMNQCH